MSSLLTIIIIGFFILCFSYLTKKRRERIPKTNLIKRFRKRFKSKSRLREKLLAEFSEALMADPESNIQIGVWDREDELREKADIHRSRLKKYGRSTMNGEEFFLGPQSGVYKYNSEGKKKYV